MQEGVIEYYGCTAFARLAKNNASKNPSNKLHPTAKET